MTSKKRPNPKVTTTAVPPRPTGMPHSTTPRNRMMAKPTGMAKGPRYPMAPVTATRIGTTKGRSAPRKRSA